MAAAASQTHSISPFIPYSCSCITLFVLALSYYHALVNSATVRSIIASGWGSGALYCQGWASARPRGRVLRAYNPLGRASHVSQVGMLDCRRLRRPPGHGDAVAAAREGALMSKSRLGAFSDGVLAIVITIMVVEAKVPHGDASLAFVAIALIGWALSGVHAVAVYRYAAEGQSDGPFTSAMVRSAFRAK